MDVLPVPLMDFIWETAIRRMVSLSGFRARALQVGTMSDSSVMYWVILLRLRRSISLWFSLKQREESKTLSYCRFCSTTNYNLFQRKNLSVHSEISAVTEVMGCHFKCVKN